MTPVSMRELLEAGVHFGHQTNRWDPRMKPYIFGARNGVYIIDLQKTVPLFEKALKFLADLTSKGERVLFVGTKRQAQTIIQESATESNQFFINHRWLGGFLTNFRTIRQSIDRLTDIEKMAEDGTFEKLTKKEVLNLNREREKLERNLGGIKGMNKLPGAIFIVDVKREHIAIAEARKLGIPVVALVDTNCDPTGIDYVIPGNDDAIRSIKIFANKVAEACIDGASRFEKAMVSQPAKEQAPKADAGEEERSTGPKVEKVASLTDSAPAQA
jgi:small subunit ribosomal protein S2